MSSSECAGDNGKREDLVARPFGYRQGRLIGEPLPVERQLVHGEKVNRGRDVLLCKRALVVVARRARSLRLDADDVR